MFKNKKAVIFDLDGTLVDSVGIYTEADKDIIELYGGTLPQNLDIIEFDRSEFIKNHTDKNTYINYCQYLIDKYNLNDTKENVLAKRLQLTKEYIKEKADFKPNAEVFINSLINKGFNIFLATSSSNFTINMYLKENMLIRNKCNLEDRKSAGTHGTPAAAGEGWIMVCDLQLVP
jgi:beta-phosphoglucomutase-like phosphatase (HAD superfamily)